MSFLINPHRFAAASSIAVVQAKSASSAAASTAVTLDAPPIEGNHLLVFACTASNSTPISVIAGFTNLQYVPALNQGEFRLMAREAGTGESATVTVQRSSSSSITQLTVIVVEIAGLDNGALVDQFTYTDSTTSAVSSISTGTTGATDTADEVAIAFSVWYDDDLSGPTWTNGFANQTTGALTSPNETNGAAWAVAAKILSSTGAQETTIDWTSGGRPEEALATIITLREA